MILAASPKNQLPSTAGTGRSGSRGCAAARAGLLVH
jgi:hypothetical protein